MVERNQLRRSRVGIGDYESTIYATRGLDASPHRGARRQLRVRTRWLRKVLILVDRNLPSALLNAMPMRPVTLPNGIFRLTMSGMRCIVVDLTMLLTEPHWPQSPIFGLMMPSIWSHGRLRPTRLRMYFLVVGLIVGLTTGLGG